ncbi:MAG: putative Zn-dependent protease [Kiritimatiellia bacterium]|jgi:predicted Zn-dependent protease
MNVRALALVFAASSLVLVAVAKVPYTGRRQLNVLPDGLMRSLGKTSYTTMLSGKAVQSRGTSSATLERVGQRIARVAKQPKYDWQFRLIEDDSLNAWCLPGGYIGFYTGILPVLENETGMAFVMGHEVGHATAKHGAERMSQRLTLLGGMAGLYLYLDGNSKMTTESKAIVVGALGVGAQFGVLLPFSRKHESEADIIGMMYMANAGYSPEESIRVWDRMDAANKGAKLPAFLSTHPSHSRRQVKLREWLPQAQKRYERHRLPGDLTRTLWEGGVSSKPSRGTKPQSNRAPTSSGESSSKPTQAPTRSTGGSEDSGKKKSNPVRTK